MRWGELVFSSDNLFRLTSAGWDGTSNGKPIPEPTCISGGVVNNLPDEPFLKDSLPRTGVSVNLLNESDEIKSTFKLKRAIRITLSKSTKFRKYYCQLYTEPENLSAYSTYDFDKLPEIFKYGYNYTKI